MDAATIDDAYNQGFFHQHYSGVDLTQLPNPGDISSLLDQPLKLQPHGQLFEMNYNLFKFRHEMLQQEVDYWLENPFPNIEKGKKFYFSLTRTLDNFMFWSELSWTSYQILLHFQKGASIEQICAWIEKQDETVQNEASEHLKDWFQNWIGQQIIYRL